MYASQYVSLFSSILTKQLSILPSLLMDWWQVRVILDSVRCLIVACVMHYIVIPGISLWDCVVSNILSRGSSSRHLDLLTFYHPLTLPVNAVYVLLLSLVLLSLLDRYESTLM